jgi:hypothetical protein
MSKIKKYIEKWFPLTFATTMVLIFYKYKLFTLQNPIFDRGQSISLVIAITVFATLITHKGIVLSIDREKHKGFEKLLRYPELTKRFFDYLNYCIYHSVILMLYNVLCEFYSSLFYSPFVMFSTIYLICQCARFLLAFNAVFKKSIQNLTNTPYQH